MIKKIFLPLLTLALVAPINAQAHSLKAEAVVLENSGDSFYLSDTSYTVSESFVYTSVATFENGQACGVVIGGESNNHYWVFNIDRYENRTKLLYFDYPGGSLRAREVKNDYFIGNDKTTTSEFNVINPKLRNCNEFNFKVVVTVEDTHAYAEFFLDNIKRFGVDSKIDLNNALDDRLQSIHDSYVHGLAGCNLLVNSCLEGYKLLCYGCVQCGHGTCAVCA